MDNKDIIRKQMHDLLDMVIDTNGIGERKRGETGTLPTVFFNYSGHVNCLTIDLHTNGWQPGEGSDKTWGFWLDDPITNENIDAIKSAFANALTEKTPADILRGDIARAEKELSDRKKSIASMKRRLKKEEKGEKDV